VARHPWVAKADTDLRWGIRLDVGDGRLDQLLVAGRAVEGLGFDGCFVCDHPSVHADPWICLASLAGVTERVRLGPVVSCVGYRHPAFLARLAADVDSISHGRLILGLGIGWLKPEFEAFGARFDSATMRYAALEESLATISGMWGTQAYAFTGKHRQTGPLRIQAPPQKPRPPLMIGGSGEKKTLRLVAQYADACNVDDIGHTKQGIVRIGGLEQIERKFSVLRRYCEEIGRPYDEVLRTHFTLRLVLARDESTAAAKATATNQLSSGSAATRRAQPSAFMTGTPGQVSEYYQALADIGVQYFVIHIDSYDIETIELLAREVVPRVTMRS
jgi:alkanesulfonate monooxygenase SsuD/methylene tetrahydromethanopterin reductase-like flavin-dependent oxidoreductase (luciferase family)